LYLIFENVVVMMYNVICSQQGFVCSVDMITSPERDMYVTWDMQKKGC
jgi:hypothetical protein